MPAVEDASLKQFREYVEEFTQLAQSANSVDQRFFYLKLANVWHETAVRWERDLVKRRSGQSELSVIRPNT